jgi:Domain of Unknown Function (DUF1259)
VLAAGSLLEHDHFVIGGLSQARATVTVAGVATPTPFGFGGWVAMTKGDGGHQVLMGDLVLLQGRSTRSCRRCSKTVWT